MPVFDTQEKGRRWLRTGSPWNPNRPSTSEAFVIAKTDISNRRGLKSWYARDARKDQRYGTAEPTRGEQLCQ
jgi:hypothetical protein